MKDYSIKWKKGDLIKLGKVVSNFNKKIAAADKTNKENIDFLPDLKKFENIKDSITTRREFNRIINSLKRINKADALDLVYTKSGEEISMWELNETRIQARIRIRQLNKEIEAFQTSKTNNQLMGSERYGEIKKEIEDIKNIDLKKGYDFKKIMRSIQTKGTADWTFKMNIVFKNNYLEALKDYQNEPYYNELIKKIQDLNPNDFYNMIKDNNLIDFLNADWYRLDRNKYSNLLRELDIANIPDYNYGSYSE